MADVDLTQAETYKITIYAFAPEQGPAAVALGAELGLHVDPSTAPQNHSNLVVFDEPSMAVGVALYAAVAIRHLTGS